MNKTILTLLKLLFRNIKGYATAAVLICGFVGLATSANTLVKQKFFESVQGLSSDGTINGAVLMGLLWGGFTLVTLLLQGVSDVMTEDLGVRFGGMIGKQVNVKASDIDPLCFEDTAMLNRINKAYEGVQRSAELIQILIGLSAFYIPYFIFFAVYTYLIHPVLCVGILLVLVPTIWGNHLLTIFYGNLEDRSAPLRRQMDYYKSCIVDREYAKETRLLGAVWFFRTLFESATLIFKKERWKTNKLVALTELGIRLFSLVVYIIILALMYRFLKTGDLNTAAFAAILTSIDQMFHYMDYVGYNLGSLAAHLPSINNTLQFLSLPEREGADADIDNYRIDFNQVSFRYPGTDKEVIKDLNLTINSGETIAIVGENGAGKSTFVKLLMGFYVPVEGDVLIGGHNTKTTSLPSIVKHVSVVFQNFQKYKMTLKENILISQTEQDFDQETFDDAIAEAEIQIENRSYPKGLDTMLSREFDGVDLSGGQWQRVAIGRGLYRNHNMILLDEPTAAIDPVEETRLYLQFANLAKNKTAVIVTHRLGSAKIADRIVVLAQGRLEDVGTHEELMSREGKYKEMYQAQAQWYE